MIDDEIVKEEAVVFMNYLGDCPDHEFLSVDTNKFPDAKACTAKMYIDIIDVPNGFDYEDFVSTPVSKLYETLLKGSEEYSEAEYDELYQPYTLSNLLQIAAKSSRQNMRADGTKENVITRFEPYLSDFCDYDAFKNSVKVADLYNRYDCIKADVKASLPYYQVREGDENIQKFIEITHSTEPVAEDLEKVDEYRTGESKVASQTFWVFDKTCARYQKVMEDDRKGNKRELLGLFPVVTTAANALYAQSLIAVDDEDVVDYESVESTITKDPTDGNTGFSLRLSDLVKGFNNENTDFTQSAVQDTVSREANNYFSTIAMNPEATGFDSENLKKIGVVVFKAFMDASEGNKVNFTPVEAFCGSLDKDAVNPNTKKSTFIDTLVNTQSEYIYLFSNCFANKTLKQKLNDAGVFIIKPGVTGMLGFYEDETAEEMSVPTLLQGIDKCFKNVEDINERDIDIIPDAGLANIAQYLYKIGGGDPVAYDLDAVDDNDNPLINLWKCQSKDDVSMWKTVQFKYDNFCKNVRKDCMFIADGPRPMVLQGQKKIVRPSKPTNTIDANILPYVKWATGLNTNYGAGYLDWFQIADEFTGDLFWCPPSIKAMGVYINTDVNFEYWDAPAGLNRGVVAALDTAFSPTSKQAGSIYTKNWNYAINYPYDGIVLEGQKTFQVKPSAFDRVNVRRLFLRLERQTNKVARYFVYEGNTAYTRQRLIDTLDPIFYQAKVGGGLYDYKIICDESINTPNVIDNNELRVKIGLKPIKSVEFILVDFVALGTGSSWSEM